MKSALAISLAVLAGAAAVTTDARRADADAPQRYVPILSQGDAVPPLPLIDQFGRPFSIAMLHGQTVIVSFIYTRCGDARMCPLVSAKFARMQHELRGAPIHLVSISLDPAFDTPSVLRRYGQTFGADARSWTLATGSAVWVDELAARLGIASQVVRPGTIAHTEAAVVIGPDGRIARIIEGNAWSASDLLGEAREVATQRGDPYAQARLWLAQAAEVCGRGVSMGASTVLAVLAALTAALTWLLLRALRSGPA